MGSSVTEFRRVLDALESIRAVVGSAGELSLPQIFVVGDQSSGKSTLLVKYGTCLCSWFRPAGVVWEAFPALRLLMESFFGREVAEYALRGFGLLLLPEGGLAISRKEVWPSLGRWFSHLLDGASPTAPLRDGGNLQCLSIERLTLRCHVEQRALRRLVPVDLCGCSVNVPS